MNNLVVFSDLKDITIKELRQFENTDRDRPEFDNKYLKMVYFFLYEGVISTLRKFFAHKQPQVRYLTFLSIERDSKKYINISVQSQTKPADFVIENKFYPYERIDFDQINSNLEKYIEEFNQYSGAYHYEEFGIDTSHFISPDTTERVYNENFDEGLFIYGLGGYIKMYVIKHFKKSLPKIACTDYKAGVTNSFRDKYGFRYGLLTPRSSYPLIQKVKSPAVIIATYHSDHTTLACDIFNLNHKARIFIEKPPVVTLEDLAKILELYKSNALLEMGFNRRFIGYSRYVREKVQGAVVMITCSVKEVLISNNHWYLWPNQGTRITGNAVHWFDLANYWTGSMPIEINVIAGPDDNESVALSVLYKNGSILHLMASDKGNSMRGVQEKIEIRFNNETIFINDFMSLSHIKNNGFQIKKRKIRRDKGHDAMYKSFHQIIRNRKSSEYSAYDLINTSIVTYYASKMLLGKERNMHIESEIIRFRKMLET